MKDGRGRGGEESEGEKRGRERNTGQRTRGRRENDDIQTVSNM